MTANLWHVDALVNDPESGNTPLPAQPAPLPVVQRPAA
jgi:hypothetical protein